MSRTINRVTLAATVLTLTLVISTESAACGGGGGGSGRISVGYGGGGVSVGFGGGGYRHTPRYNPAPVYRQPVYQPPVVQRPVYQQPVVQQPTFQQPVQSFPQPSHVAPVQQQPVQPQAAPQQQRQPASQQVAPQAAPAATPEQSALNALAAFGGVQTAAPVQQAGHVGTWRATVGGSQVALNLSADGSFDWTANSNGKTSRFAGRFTIVGGQLTLIRNDSQQLAGTWTADATGGFRFKLASANDSGLLFVRG